MPFAFVRSSERIVCSRFQATQVFSNLVVNALEALSPEGTIKLHVLASRDWRNPKRRGVRVFIADNGPGGFS